MSERAEVIGEANLAIPAEATSDFSYRQAINGLGTSQIRSLLLEVANRDASVGRKMQELYEETWGSPSPTAMDYSPEGTRLTPFTIHTSQDAMRGSSPIDYLERIRDLNGSKQLEKILLEGQNPKLIAKIKYASDRARCAAKDDEWEYVYNVGSCIRTLNKHYQDYDSGETSNHNDAGQVWATLTAHIGFIKDSVNRLSSLTKKEFALSDVCEIAEAMLDKDHGALCELIRQRLGPGESQDQCIEDAIEHIVGSYTEHEMDTLPLEDSCGHQSLGWLVDHSRRLELLNEPRLRAALNAFHYEL